jgi:protease-4
VVSYYRPGSYKGSIYAGSTEKEWLAELTGGLDAVSNGSFMYLWRP